MLHRRAKSSAYLARRRPAPRAHMRRAHRPQRPMPTIYSRGPWECSYGLIGRSQVTGIPPFEMDPYRLLPTPALTVRTPSTFVPLMSSPLIPCPEVCECTMVTVPVGHPFNGVIPPGVRR